MKVPNWLKNIGLFVLTLSLLLLLPLAGIFAGSLVSRAWMRGAFVRWHRLPASPQRPARIVGGDLNVVFVETTEGQIYSCNSFVLRRCWVPAKSPGKPAKGNHHFLGPEARLGIPLDYWVSNPPGKVIDRLKVHWRHFEGNARSDFVILEDGSVWVWKHHDSGYDNLARFLPATIIGGALGLLGGVTISAVIWWKRYRKQRDRAAA